MPRVTKTAIPVSIGVPFDLLNQVDELAENLNISRSSYVVEAIREKVKKDLKQKN